MPSGRDLWCEPVVAESNSFKKDVKILLGPDSPSEMGLWSDEDSHRALGVNDKHMGRAELLSGLSTQDSEAHTGKRQGT